MAKNKTETKYEVRSTHPGLTSQGVSIVELEETDEESAIHYAKNMIDQERQVYVQKIVTEIIWLNHN